MDIKWLEQIAPTLASALGSPLAGIAVSALESALGLSGQTKDTITSVLQSGQMTGEQLAAVKQAELVLKQHESDNGFKFAELGIRDMESARAREVSVKDKMPAILGMTAVIGGFVIGGLVIAGMAPALKDPALAATAGTIVGYVFNEIKQVYSYYFGTTSHSQLAQDTIAQIAKAP